MPIFFYPRAPPGTGEAEHMDSIITSLCNFVVFSIGCSTLVRVVMCCNAIKRHRFRQPWRQHGRPSMPSKPLPDVWCPQHASYLLAMPCILPACMHTCLHASLLWLPGASEWPASLRHCLDSTALPLLLLLLYESCMHHGTSPC